MCREEALDVTSLLNEKDSFSRFKLLAVIKEVAPTKKCADDECLGVSDFATKYFPDGDVFHEPSGGFWEALGGRRVTSQGLSTYNPFKLYRGAKEIGRRQTEKGIEGNLAGEGIVQGGIIVLNGAGGVEYMYKEKTGYQIPRDEIVEVLDRMVG